MTPRIPVPEDFSSRLRSHPVTARVGRWLAISFTVCFLTGLISHYAQNPTHPIPFPTSPAWGYRLTQGVHVTSGTMAVPLLLVKLWLVYPRLFQRPPPELRRLAGHVAERAAVGVLVASGIFLLASGLANAAQWYPWEFSFRRTHYAVAWTAVGALLVHIAVRLPQIRAGLAERPTEDPDESGALSRRGLLRVTAMTAGVAALATAGSAVPWLRRVSVFAVRSGRGPQGIPVNKSALAAGVTETARAADYRLEVVHGSRIVRLTRADLLALPQHTERLPIACVEGWSASGDWTGVRVRDLLELVDAPPDSTLAVHSLQSSGPFRSTTLPGNFAADHRTLLALRLGGEELVLDHGYPARLIAPNRPGVLQTKWVARLEVES